MSENAISFKIAANKILQFYFMTSVVDAFLYFVYYVDMCVWGIFPFLSQCFVSNFISDELSHHFDAVFQFVNVFIVIKT